MIFAPSTLEQRDAYYSREFDMEKARAWFSRNRLPFPQLCALDCGSDTGIIKFPEKKGKMISFRAEHIMEKALLYLPEDLYYDRNAYTDPAGMLRTLRFKGALDSGLATSQELVFDIDPENTGCECDSRIFCENCSREAVWQAILLAEKLKEDFGNIGLVYSGRGMHVHVFDKDASLLTIAQREELNKRLKKFPIDPWVSRGNIRLIRMPYSLNSLVSRIVTPMSIAEAERFDPMTSAIAVPKFLQSDSSDASSLS